MRPVTFLFWGILLSSCSGIPDSAWDRARMELSTIRTMDRRYRKSMDSVGRAEGWQSKAVVELWEKQRSLDSANLVALDQIITKYGYPPSNKVGELSQVPLDVLRHANEAIRAEYLNLVIGAGKNGDIPMRDVAVYYDEVLMMQRVPQEYGTQVWIEYKDNPATGERLDSLYLWPVRDFPNVDKRRLSVGLDSLAQHLRRFGMDPEKKYLIRKSGKRV